MFGSIKPTPPPSSTTFSSSLILLLLAGGVGAAALLKGKTASSPAEASKNEPAKEERRSARTEEPVDHPSSTERLQPKPETKSSACSIPPSSVKECEVKIKVKSESETRKEEKNRKEEETRKEDAKEEENKPVLNEAKTRIVPKIIVSPEVAKEASPEAVEKIVPVQTKVESVKETFSTEQSTNPPVKTKFEDLSINLTTVDELEEVDYITKIKTFKITRWPKTHTADFVQHEPDSLLSVLLPLQLQVTLDNPERDFPFTF